MTWIDPEYKNEDGTLYNKGSFVANSTDKGYYSQSSPTTTGSDANYAVKNIYDLAGNVFEWTMEAFSSTLRVTRGGFYNNSGENHPASNRYNGFPPSDSSEGVGFRSALYL